MTRRIDARTGTALALMPVALGITLFGAPGLFAGLCALVALAGAWEWAGIMAPQRPRRKALGVALTALLLAWYYYHASLVLALYITAMALLWWAAALLLIIRWQYGREFTPGLLLQVVAGMLTLAPAWVALVTLRAQGETLGPALVVCLFALVWSADIGAYYTGKRWGRRKLAPRLSPGKTLEGLAGAFACGLAAALFCAALLLYEGGPGLAPFLVVCMVTVAMSIIGDLTESMIKRSAGVKDSGALLPGHGGVLDRIDSLSAAAPAFFVGMAVLEGGA